MIPYNVFEQINKPKKYIVYGDSVSGKMSTVVIINDVLNYLTFDEIWNIIATDDNVVKINNKEYIYIKDLNINLKTLSYNKKTDKIEMNIPLYLMRHKINEKICRINVTNYSHLDVTNNHSLLHYNGTELVKISPTNAQYLPVIRYQYDDFNNELNLIYYVLGLWFADVSYTSSDHYPSLSSKHSYELCKYLTSLDSEFKPYLRKTGKLNDFQFNYKPVRTILLENDLKSKKSFERYLSKPLFNNLKNNLIDFISFFAGYYTGDGSFNSNVIVFSSSNIKLLKQLNELLLYYGIYSHISIDKNNRKYNNNVIGDMYKLKVLGVCNSIYNILSQFDVFKDSKIENGKSLNYGHNFSSVGHENKGIVRGYDNIDLYEIKPIKIQNKTQIDYNGYVYDFSIENNQNFFVNGILVHNTDSLYINVPTIKPKTAEEAVDTAEKIAKGINDTITNYMENNLLPRMGIDKQYNKTEFKTELVADGLILLDAKKSYAYRLLAREGKIMPKPIIEYTGIAVKSDISQWSKDFIHTIIEDIVLNPNIQNTDIMNHLNKIAHKFRAKMQTCIDEYDFEYIGVPKKWGSNYKKGDPWQIIAMKLYNTIVNERVLVPMSGSIIIPIQLKNPYDFEMKIASIKNNDPLYIENIPISKLSQLAIPYNCNKEKLKKAMIYYGIEIDINDVWDKIYNKQAQSIIELQKQILRQNTLGIKGG